MRLRLVWWVLILCIAVGPPSAFGQNLNRQKNTGLEIGQRFPELALPDLDGAPRTIASFRGQKVILHVFASW